MPAGGWAAPSISTQSIDLWPSGYRCRAFALSNGRAAEHSFAATMASLHSIPAFLSNQCAAGSILSLDSSGQVQIDHARHGILTEGRFRVSSVVMEVSPYSQVSPERDDAVDTQKKNMVSFSMCEDEATLVYSERR